MAMRREHLGYRLREKDRWTTLRSIGNSSLVKLTMLIPIVGWLIIFNDLVVHGLRVARSLFGPNDVAVDGGSIVVSPRLLWLYVGLFLVSIGSIIYSICCPNEIKKYSSETDYSKDIFGHTSIRERERIQEILSNSTDHATISDLEQLRSRLGLSDEAHRESAIKSFDRNPAATASVFAAINNYFNGVYDLYFQLQNKSGTYWRWASALFYGLGFSILFGLAICNFYSVVRILVRSL
jgi:hypothetical protein